MKMMSLLFFTMILALAGCSNKPDSSADGHALYDYHCADCHRQDGHGNFLEGIPSNRGTYLSPSEVKTLITQGLSSKPAMPPVQGLTDEQADKIVSYLWSLRKP